MENDVLSCRGTSKKLQLTDATYFGSGKKLLMYIVTIKIVSLARVGEIINMHAAL